ncbi:hypothetical protein BDW74DRAFT_175578 [Aspergillus multicolor]|uniref:fungal specific transcription factor domain-containing protein n=1 Tax=Aspergillus multicolor TaxID=41759 RepID=UPI003CCD06A1
MHWAKTSQEGADKFLPKDCTFPNHHLSYIQSLNNRIDDLTARLALHQPQVAAFDSSISPVSASSSFVPAGAGADLYLDSSTPSRMTRLVFEIITPTQMDGSLEEEDETFAPPENLFTDESLLTAGNMRFLLRRYQRCIEPRYSIPLPEIVDGDIAKFKKMPDGLRFKVLMACAIAAARETYRSPDWRALAQVCRNWANDILPPIISTGDTQALTAIILLLIYELAEPSRGIVWELLDLAARTCLQLGWHQLGRGVVGASPASGLDNTGATIQANPDEVRLMMVLDDVEESLQTIFNRPNMVNAMRLPCSDERKTFMDIFLKISEELYLAGRVYESRSCPFLGEIGNLMGCLESTASAHSIIKEAWLLFLPVCVKHKQCLHCFQEPDQHHTKGMTSLRRRVVKASTDLIEDIHYTATSMHGFIPPIVVCARTFIAGCTLAVALLKGWIQPMSHVNYLMSCTEILTMFAPHWNGGHRYLVVWKRILDGINLQLNGLRE